MSMSIYKVVNYKKVMDKGEKKIRSGPDHLGFGVR